MRVSLFTIVAVILVACGGRGGDADALTGRILLWHSYDDTATAALDDILARFAEVNPQTVVKAQRFPSEEAMMAQFQASAAGGLGPDALITSSEWVLPLAQAGLLRPLDDLSEDERARFMPDALTTLEVDDRLYGLPESVSTAVLFYNKRLVEQPATSLDMLLADATAGNYVAMSSGFRDAFWGVGTFGGELFDEDGRIILDRGGFANWLEWLKTVRDRPGVVVDSDQAFLRSEFLGGSVAYLIADADEYAQLVAELGDSLGVAPLPSGPVGSAAPFLHTGAVLISSASSDEQAELALALAKFFTNAEQSATFMRRAQLAPANEQVRINPRLNPAVSAMAAQARNAVPLPNAAQRDEILRGLEDAQTRVLAGVLEPATAVAEATQALNGRMGFDAQAAPEQVCSAIGVVRVANLLPGAGADVLRELTDEFRRLCSTIIVEMTVLTADEAQDTDAVINRYDLVVGSQEALVALVTDGEIQELSARADAERLQRFWPQTIAGMRVDGGLYGQPLAAYTSALYFNRSLTEQPARNLDELQRQAVDGVPLILEAEFANAFWGISAFSAQPLTTGFNVVLDVQAQSDWLNWIIAMRDTGRSQIVFDHAAARQGFLDGKSAYFVGTLADYDALADAMGADNLGVVTLPSGPGGDASPLMLTAGFMLTSRFPLAQIDAVAEYTRYITNGENQRRLAQLASVIPANASTDLTDLNAVVQFVEQMQTATVMPNLPQVNEVIALGNALYVDVLQNGVDVGSAVTETVTLMAETLDVATMTTPEP